MIRFLVRRLMQNVLLLAVMSVITFTLLHLAPNSPFVIEGDPSQSVADVQRLRANYGLDQPLPVQYALWVGRLLQGDLGRSYATPEPVAGLIWDRVPATLLLAVSALVLSFGIGVPMGIYAAVHRGTWLDNLIRVFTVVVDATPSFWLGLLAIVFLGGQLGWFPQGGMYDLTNRNQSYIRSAGHLGWAFCAGLGAKCACPERPVVVFTGDAGLWYHIGEIETAVRNRIRTVTVVNNNSSGNQSKRGFDRAYGGQQTEAAYRLWTFNKVNFARLAEDMGAIGIRIEDPKELETALRRSFDADRPVILDVVTDIEALAPLAVR